MPIFMLSRELVFPPPEGANEDGIVAVGGDASPERLVLGYSQGIFAWPVSGLPLLWFSPDPRFVLVPAQAHIPRSLRKRIRRGEYEVRADTTFADVISECASVPRPGQRGTWITEELCEGYLALHEGGYAHSIEAWHEGELVGGLYGVALGKMFFGESMFATREDASKVAFVTLLAHLTLWGYELVDCQVYTEHLARFGAEEWPREKFLARLRKLVAHKTQVGPWKLTLGPEEVAERFSVNAEGK